MGCVAAPIFEGPAGLIAASCLVSDYKIMPGFIAGIKKPRF